jgi:hypothetical protein
MTTVAETSDAIHQLPTDARWNWLHEFADELWTDWDRQIEADLTTGRLDSLLSRARADIAESKTRDLSEVIRDS